MADYIAECMRSLEAVASEAGWRLRKAERQALEQLLEEDSYAAAHVLLDSWIAEDLAADEDIREVL